MSRRRVILAAGSLLDQPAEVVLDAAAAAGFDGVGLRLSGEHAVANPAALADRATALGLAVDDVEVYRITGSPTDPAPLLDVAAAVGAGAVLAVSDVEDRHATEAALGALVAAAAARGLRVALEYMAWTCPAQPDVAIAMARAAGCVVVVDVLHHVRVGAGTAELRAIVESGLLGWVQLCDATPPRLGAVPAELVHEARHRRLPPGRGDLPLAALIDVIPDDVTVSVEVQSDTLLAVPPTARARLLRDAAVGVLAGGPAHPSRTG